MSNKEIEQQNMIKRQSISPTIDNLGEQVPSSKEAPAEKMDIAQKLILASLGIESNVSLDNFDKQLEEATKTLPRYKQIEEQLKGKKNEELPYELFKTLKTNSDKIKTDESTPRDGSLITSMKQGNLECAGRTLIASTYLQERNFNHAIVSAPGHAFIMVEQSPDTLAYFDANNNLFFTFPRQALEGYKGVETTSECSLKEYSPRETDFYDGVSAVFSDFITMPAKEGVGRQYLGNVSAALNGNKEFEMSNIEVDKEASRATQQIEEEIYGKNEVLDNYYSKVENLINKQEIQTDDDRKVIGEIIKSYPKHEDFVSFFSATLDGNLGTRVPYIKNSSKEQKIAFAEKAWDSFKNKENKIEKPQIKDGVNFVFEQNPELTQIGTKEQYSEYLDTIFPDSKVRDIVYHASSNKIEKFRDNMFGAYFSYSPIQGVYGDVINNVLLNIKSLLIKPKPEDSTEEKVIYDKEYRSYNNPSFSPEGDRIYKYDASVENSTVTKEGIQIKVRNPEQIHILGSEQDIENFKKFVANENET